MMLTVGELMRREIAKVRYDIPLGHVLEVMSVHNQPEVPVIDAQGQLFGLATERALRRYSRRGITKFPINQVCERVTEASCIDDDAVSVLSRQLREGRDASIVVDKLRRPVGIFTVRDALGLAKTRLSADLTVGDIALRGDAPWVRAEAGCGDVLRAMVERKAGHALVLRDRVLAGVISLQELVGQDDKPVESLMGRIVLTVRESTPLVKTIPRLQYLRSGALPVVDDLGRVVGMVSRRMVVARLAEELFDSSHADRSAEVSRPARAMLS